jgi:predicted nucleic acid-binding protein
VKADVSDRLVIDASVTVAWCFEAEKTPYTEEILERISRGAEAIVPSLWSFEIVNALLHAERRKRITAAQATAFLKQLEGFHFVVDLAPLPRVFDWIFIEARQQNLTAYDAAYLELALRHNLPLATLDGNLKRAAKDLGIPSK